MSVTACTGRVVRRASSAEAASYPCPVIRISSIERAQRFVDDAILQVRSAGSIEDLIIDIPGLPIFNDIIPAPIRPSLQLVPQITDLTLFLPATTPPALLTDVNFPALHFFNSNLPHAVLTAFLTRHRTLSILVLGRCGTPRQCSLLNVDLTHVTDLECGTECARSLVHSDLFHLTIRKSPEGPPIGVIFRTSPICASGLHSLTVDFFPDDVDLLNNLSLFAPFLRKLKLVEQHRASRRNQSGRRAFNDAPTWARALRKLRFLEELSLQTSVGLVQRAGDYHLEHRLVMGWIYGVRARVDRRLPASARAHPNLYHIRIWYGARGNDAALSKWYKDGGEWRRLGLPIVGDDLADVDF